MKAIFADTFYWIALTVPTEAAHKQASRFAGEIITTDEVLSEYLTFFSAYAGHVRQEVALTVRDILEDPGIRVIPQSRQSFLGVSLAAFLCMRRGSIKATALLIASPCRPCAVKD